MSLTGLIATYLIQLVFSSGGASPQKRVFFESEAMNITCATTPEQLEEVRKLFRDYEAYLAVDLSFQDFERELAELPGKYAPPGGTLLIAEQGQEVCGCGALRAFGSCGDRICEMKRLYVRPAARGRGVGRRIAQRLIEEALRLGYRTMILDTFARLEAAIQLYRSLGFAPTEAYYDNPLPGVVYWKLDLERRQLA